MLQLEERRYVWLVYQALLRLKGRNWAFKIKLLLQKYGFGAVWDTQGVGNVKAFISLLEQRVKDY
jgi:hypothetical protein